MRHCVMALLLLLGAQAAVSDGLSETGEEKPQTLTFNVSSGGYPPFTIVHDNGAISGIFWEVLSVIADRHQITLESVELPPKRSDDLLREDYADVTMRAIEWTSNPDAFEFSDPVMMTRDAIFVHRRSPLVIRSVEDLRGTLLTRLGFRYPWLDGAVRHGAVDLIPVQDQSAMFKRLYHGGARFTGAVSNLHAGYWTLKNSSWEDSIRQAPIRLEEVGYRLMFPPRHADLVPLINRELDRMRQSGELDRIIQSYR